MANTTTCPKCGKLYEESSEEESNNPERECLGCFQENTTKKEEQENGRT